MAADGGMSAVDRGGRGGKTASWAREEAVYELGELCGDGDGLGEEEEDE